MTLTGGCVTGSTRGRTPTGMPRRASRERGLS